MERNKKTKKSYKLKNQGYYTQGDEETERRYNHYLEKNYSFNNKIVSVMENIIEENHQ